MYVPAHPYSLRISEKNANRFLSDFFKLYFPYHKIDGTFEFLSFAVNGSKELKK